MPKLPPADPNLQLIETLLWDGRGFPRLALHQARLARSARALAWPDPDPGWGLHLAATLPAEPRRIRLTLAADGALEWQTAQLPPAKPLWQIALAQPRLDSADPWLRLKSTRRALYDQSRAALPAGIDELIFRNERDEICEGTITTLFFDRGEGLRTPPLSCGLLPGVLRAELACPEEILRAADLPHVRLWLGNALRGLIPAHLAARPDPS